jgi:hypothetical protein
MYPVSGYAPQICRACHFDESRGRLEKRLVNGIYVAKKDSLTTWYDCLAYFLAAASEDDPGDGCECRALIFDGDILIFHDL